MEALPDEIILLIFKSIIPCVDTILNLGQVCKRLYSIAHDEEIWHHMCREKYNVINLNHIKKIKEIIRERKEKLFQQFKPDQIFSRQNSFAISINSKTHPDLCYLRNIKEEQARLWKELLIKLETHKLYHIQVKISDLYIGEIFLHPLDTQERILKKLEPFYQYTSYCNIQFGVKRCDKIEFISYKFISTILCISTFDFDIPSIQFINIIPGR